MRHARRALSDEILRLSRRHAHSPLLVDLRALIADLAALHTDDATDTNFPQLASERAEQGWTGLLAAMVLVTPQTWDAAPRITDVPDWLWSDYSTWLFSRASGAADSSGLVRHLEDLLNWVTRNPGSTAVKAAAEAWLRHGVAGITCAAPTDRRRAAELRGQLLARLLAKKGDDWLELPALAAIGRPLRVGFIHDSCEANDATCELLAFVEHADTTQLEPRLYVLRETASAVETYTRTKHLYFQVLPGDLTEQLRTLRAEELDVAFYVRDLAASADDLVRLALHRVAPLQVALGRAGRSAGLPTIDFEIVAGEAAPDRAAASPHRVASLRLAHLPLALPSTMEAPVELTRAALEISATDTVLAAVVTTPKPSTAALELWAHVLAAAPTARFIIAHTAAGADEFCDQWQAIMQRAGLMTERSAVFPASAESPAAVRALVGLADVYLDNGDSETLWAAEALRLGRPAVALTPRSRAAQLVRSIGLSELVAGSTDAAVTLAARLANRAELRETLAPRILATVEADTAGVLDTLAAGECLVATLRTAHNQLVNDGRDAFRAAGSPLELPKTEDLDATLAEATAALRRGDRELAAVHVQLALHTAPTHAAARLRQAQLLMADHRAGLAVTNLLAVVQRTPEDANVWFLLAEALHADNQTTQAIEALETSLRLNHDQPDGWTMLAELAGAVGATDLADEARQVARSLTRDKSGATSGSTIKLNLSGKLRSLRTGALGTAS
ncbi:MAG TPA: tetratricopeptide repeat protein [Candidatus Synoicihabitans sp.]|nr:tetratricopeptide repeat protein [Candidatus Synoicihabitans sp.]